MVRFVAIRENLIERATVFSISDYFAIMDRLYQFELDLLAALGNDSGRSRIALRGQLVELCSRVAACHDVACAKCLGQLGRHLRPGFACEHLSSWVLAWVLLPQSQA